ncbi:hypothetical protein BpHYR1_041091 [Brachionus plicatilis]|uniref:Uncharacterized protein n=1 Tax=Brachionus plicatilis TaxID=10195 RepID=A0A3M7SRK7_BRAPC|nr:hypothetical protein BpHYR1_041091 [Brachionus plicatilis]
MHRNYRMNLYEDFWFSIWKKIKLKDNVSKAFGEIFTLSEFINISNFRCKCRTKTLVLFPTPSQSAILNLEYSPHHLENHGTINAFLSL